MNKATIVVFLLLHYSNLFATSLSDSINRLESDWAVSYYLNTPEQRKSDYPKLIRRATKIAKQFPQAAEPKIWQAILLSANAAYEPPLAALSSLDNAKQILEQTIDTQPTALAGAAYVTLGTLYYMVPGWPVSFGDNEQAEQLLKKALQIHPDGIDTNYFYGDYLLSQDKFDEAAKYFKAATEAPIRTEQLLADLQLQKSARIALAKTQTRKHSEDENNFLSLFSSFNYESKN